MHKLAFVGISCLSLVFFRCSNECSPATPLKNWDVALNPPTPTGGQNPQVIAEKDGLTFKLADSRNQESAQITSKQNLSGDFTVDFRFELHTNILGTAFQVTAAPVQGNGFSVNGHLVRSSINNSVPFFAETGYNVPSGGIDPQIQKMVQQTARNSGDIQLARRGTNMIVTVYPDGEIPAAQIYPNFGSMPVQIKAQLFSSSTLPTQNTGEESLAKTTGLTVTQDSGFSFETFSCDSVE